VNIAFLSLFFGLISGPYPVELTMDGPAASVEVLVDGRRAGTIPGPPWKATVNLGRGLLPHEIVARALDAQGREVGRAQEWANLPHPLTRVDIELERDGNDPPKAAKVLWKNLAGDKLLSLSLSFDGLPVKLDAQGRGALPPHDLKSLHFLAAQADFGSGRSVRRELAYGGEYGSEVATELTGVPVHATGKLPPAGKLGGWFLTGGKPLSVDAVEEGPAQLFVISAVPAEELEAKAAKLRRLTWNLVGAGDEILFVLPSAQRIEGSTERSDLFPISPPVRAAVEGGTDLFQTLRRMPTFLPDSYRIADAVASAGLAAMTQNRRRAVLLVLAGEGNDRSLYDPATVRRFLAALRVPLFVWYLGSPKPGSTAAAWGAEEIVQTWHVAAAAERVRKELDSQRIVMVDGRHLPQSIALSPAATGVELVGGRP
jgi:hypothetical protein